VREQAATHGQAAAASRSRTCWSVYACIVSFVQYFWCEVFGAWQALAWHVHHQWALCIRHVECMMLYAARCGSCAALGQRSCEV